MQMPRLQGDIFDPFQVADIASSIGLIVDRLPADSSKEYTKGLRHEPAENHPSPNRKVTVNDIGGDAYHSADPPGQCATIATQH